MGMTEEQIQQAQQNIDSRGEPVDGKPAAVAQPPSPASQADSRSSLWTLLIAPVAGYLVGFTATTWFNLSVVGLIVLAVAVILSTKRFYAGFAGLLGMLLFAGTATAYRMQDSPLVAQYAAPYIAMIDNDLCKALVCQRARPVQTDTNVELLGQEQAYIAGPGVASNQPASRTTLASDEELSAVRASQDRLAAEQRQLEIDEEQRLDDEQRRQNEAEEQKDRFYRAAISNFEFPSSNCTRPAVPSTDASDYTLTVFDNAAADYSECVGNAIRRDEQAVARLVEELDGSFDKSGGTYHVSVWQRFSEPAQDVIDSLVNRNERRVGRHNALGDAIDRRNEQVNRDEYWAGLQESVDRFEYDMEQQRQSSWQSWNNNNVYVSPGYN